MCFIQIHPYPSEAESYQDQARIFKNLLRRGYGIEVAYCGSGPKSKLGWNPAFGQAKKSPYIVVLKVYPNE